MKYVFVTIALTLVGAYLYDKLRATPLLNSDDPYPWPVPPGSDMPVPTTSAPPATGWRLRVTTAANQLRMASDNADASGYPTSTRNAWANRIANEAPFQTREALLFMLRGVTPYRTGTARNADMFAAANAFNMAIENLRRELNTLDAYNVVVQPTMPNVYSVAGYTP